MSWLEGRLPKWGPFGGGSTALLEREETPEAEVVSYDGGPQLMVLVSDASGVACFKSHAFPDAQSATEFVLYWFRHDTDGFSAFWAMTEEPRPQDGIVLGAVAEPLVIIKDLDRTDVVYSFSFVDIESARAFVDDEIQRGTDLEQITLYWAAPVRLTTDALGKAILTPSVPPGVEEQTRAESGEMWSRVEQPAVEQASEPDGASEARLVFQEAPHAHTGVANGMSVGQETFELTSWIERARRKPRTNGAEETPPASPSFNSRFDDRETAAFEPPAITDELPLVDARESSAGAARIAETVEGPALAPQPPVSGNAFEDAAVEVVFEEAVVAAVTEDNVVEAVAEEAVMEAPAAESAQAPAQVEVEGGVELEDQHEQRLEAPVHDTQSDIQSVAPSLEIEAAGHSEEPHERSNGYENGFIRLEPFDLVVHTNGHAKVEPAEPPSEVTEPPEATVQRGAEHTLEDETADALEIRIDIQLGSSRAMKVKRWEAKDKPFDGFKSPPGRF